jgi:2-polyprenyl-3-methyl-5-hydroxy-6-metoxy-1,4-benzoquinol methylase
MSSIERISQDYDAQWFKHFEGLKEEFEIVADAIYREFLPERVVDVGCGPGLILDRLRYYEVGVLGLEGSKHGIVAAPPSIQPHLLHMDITTDEAFKEIRTFGWRGLIICTEVAEHLPAEQAPLLVKNLCAAMAPIVFTAAPPGQGGHHHVNEQLKGYWQNLFYQHGVLVDGDTTSSLIYRLSALKKMPYLRDNLMVLR